MKVIITNDYDEMSKTAFKFIKNEIKDNPEAVLGLATGSTPIGLYEYMVRDYRENGTSYARITTVNLDEYEGLSPQNEQSYAFFMDKHLFGQIDIDRKNTFLPDGTAENSKEECRRYNSLLKEHVPDVQILGIGSNGHIGFNEPGTDFESVTHLVQLMQNTIKDNSRLFDDISQVPRRAYSMGIKNILSAKKIIVMASGANKAKAVYEMVNGKISADCPATALRNHSDVTVIVDAAAGKLLK